MTSSLIRRALLLLTLCAAFLPASASAQVFGRLDNLEARGATYVYARPGEPTVRVSVVGDVRAPGLYEVNPSFDLATLIAFAGGPTAPPEQNQLEQRTTVRLLRGDSRAVVYEGEWVDVQSVAPVALEDGDQVYIRLYTRRILTWRENLTFVTAGVAVLNLVVNLLR